MKSINCLSKWYTSYLAFLIDAKMRRIPVVCNFSEFLPEDLPGFPRDRQVELTIDLLPGTTTIAKAPYQLAPKKE